MNRLRIESRLPWKRTRREVDVPKGSTALEAFRAAGFDDEAGQVLFIVNGVVCLDDEAVPEGAVLEVFARMHGG